MSATSDTLSAPAQTRRIEMRALVRRINRALARDHRQLYKSRGWDPDFGEYYVLDHRLSALVGRDVNPEALGRELGVLRPGEGLAD